MFPHTSVFFLNKYFLSVCIGAQEVEHRNIDKQDLYILTNTSVERNRDWIVQNVTKRFRVDVSEKWWIICRSYFVNSVVSKNVVVIYVLYSRLIKGIFTQSLNYKSDYKKPL